MNCSFSILFKINCNNKKQNKLRYEHFLIEVIRVYIIVDSNKSSTVPGVLSRTFKGTPYNGLTFWISEQLKD